MQKKSLFFFSFPSERNFDEVKIANKREQYKGKTDVFHFIVELKEQRTTIILLILLFETSHVNL